MFIDIFSERINQIIKIKKSNNYTEISQISSKLEQHEVKLSAIRNRWS